MVSEFEILFMCGPRFDDTKAESASIAIFSTDHMPATPVAIAGVMRGERLMGKLWTSFES